MREIFEDESKTLKNFSFQIQKIDLMCMFCSWFGNIKVTQAWRIPQFFMTRKNKWPMGHIAHPCINVLRIANSNTYNNSDICYVASLYKIKVHV